MITQLTKKSTLLVLSALCSASLFVGCSSEPTPSSTVAPSVSEGTPEQTSPMGARQMVDIDGNRFVFINNGEAIDESLLQLGDTLGTLHDGTRYALTNYDSQFRQAFKYEESFYIIENVSKSDDSKMDLTAYLDSADFESHVMYADIFDHRGGNILDHLPIEDVSKVLAAYREAVHMDLEESDYEAIAKAQSEDNSYKLVFTLEDHTLFSSYVIPSLGYVTIGDYTCKIENFETLMGDLFKDLVATEKVIMN